MRVLNALVDAAILGRSGRGFWPQRGAAVEERALFARGEGPGRSGAHGRSVLHAPMHRHEGRGRTVIAFQHIMCPIDYSPSSLKALEYALELGRQADGRVTVLYAHEPQRSRSISLSWAPRDVAASS
jgi:hypothetical protein